jgi:nicotinamide mononucleotide adenylyltransferase
LSALHRYGTVGVVGRFKPLHNGGAAMFDAVCANADRVIIGIGGVLTGNPARPYKYDARHPFTPDETRGMLEAYLAPRFSNYRIIFVPDFGHMPEYSDGQRWRQEVKMLYKDATAFATANEYVTELLKDDFEVFHPAVLIPSIYQVYVSGTIVRQSMARGGEAWKTLVPSEVAVYMESRGLVDRFREEFGLETIARAGEYAWPENASDEREHVMEI